MMSSVPRMGTQYCKDWSDANRPRSSTFISGELGGWNISRIFQPPSEPAAMMPSSAGETCGLALFCWTHIRRFLSPLGHLVLMAGKRNCNRKVLHTERSTVSMLRVHTAPRG